MGDGGIGLDEDEFPVLHSSPEVVTFHQLRLRGHDISVVYSDWRMLQRKPLSF
jgi:hypothetical protein